MFIGETVDVALLADIDWFYDFEQPSPFIIAAWRGVTYRVATVGFTFAGGC